MEPPERSKTFGVNPKDHGSELVSFALPHDFGANLYYLDKKTRRLLELVGHGSPLEKYLTRSKTTFRILRILKTLEQIDEEFGVFWNDNEHKIDESTSSDEFDERFSPRFKSIRDKAKTMGRILDRVEDPIQNVFVRERDFHAWEEAKSISAAIGYFADRSQYYIKGLAELAKYNQVIDREPTNLNIFFNQQKTLLIDNDQRSNIVIVNDLPTTRIDYSHCFTLFSNLIRNSLKYRRGKKCKISVLFDPRDGRDSFERFRFFRYLPHNEQSDSHWTIHIVDDGIGISSENLERVFEPFRRGVERDEEAAIVNKERNLASIARIGDYSGVGLGLAIAQRVAVLYGGAIYATSESGEGTCISVDLPNSLMVGRVKKNLGDWH